MGLDRCRVVGDRLDSTALARTVSRYDRDSGHSARKSESRRPFLRYPLCAYQQKLCVLALVGIPLHIMLNATTFKMENVDMPFSFVRESAGDLT